LEARLTAAGNTHLRGWVALPRPGRHRAGRADDLCPAARAVPIAVRPTEGSAERSDARTVAWSNAHLGRACAGGRGRIPWLHRGWLAAAGEPQGNAQGSLRGFPASIAARRRGSARA